IFSFIEKRQPGKKNSLFSDEPRSKLTGHSPENFRPKRRNHEFLRTKNLRPFRATKETHAASRRGIPLD
ncbi:MAG: hypothetical protein M3Q33_09565, partial [Acidobacteriota bacterium]|nr:hypothetical protein [Acidobacteriota bacterium]